MTNSRKSEPIIIPVFVADSQPLGFAKHSRVIPRQAGSCCSYTSFFTLPREGHRTTHLLRDPRELVSQVNTFFRLACANHETPHLSSESLPKAAIRWKVLRPLVVRFNRKTSHMPGKLARGGGRNEMRGTMSPRGSSHSEGRRGSWDGVVVQKHGLDRDKLGRGHPVAVCEEGASPNATYFDTRVVGNSVARAW